MNRVLLRHFVAYEFNDMVSGEDIVATVEPDDVTAGHLNAVVCGLMCLLHPSCLAFALNTSVRRCLLLNTTFTQSTDVLSPLGWRYYTAKRRLPVSCAEAMVCGGTGDGNYWVNPTPLWAAGAVLVYCYQNKDYITVDKDRNFAERKPQGLSTCSGPVVHRTNFSKIQINLKTLQVNSGDVTFAETTGDAVAYGQAHDCSGNIGQTCVRPELNLDLTGTGFRLSSNTTWLAEGHNAHILLGTRGWGDLTVYVQCGGYCGTCLPGGGGEVFLEISGNTDPDMTSGNVVYCTY